MMMTTMVLYTRQICAIKVSWGSTEHKKQKGTKELLHSLQLMAGGAVYG
jgi:hypothetical protein